MTIKSDAALSSIYKEISSYTAQFPLIKNSNIVYLDNAATTQKPQCVLDIINDFYAKQYATVHRGVYSLSSEATLAYENAREKIAKLLNAPKDDHMVFTKGTTEAINLVAHCFAAAFIKAGDRIIISAMEHHANIVPWQLVCESYGAELKVIPLNSNDELDMCVYDELLTSNTKMVAITHVSNVLGTVNPIKEITTKAHRVGAAVCVDGAQAVAHTVVDLTDLDCDFYAFSGHKCYGPMGVGVLYGKDKWLRDMPPYQTGGAMIETVSFEKTTYQCPPQRFEAGTPNVVGVLGLLRALIFIHDMGFERIHAYENELLRRAELLFQSIEGIKILGRSKNKAAVLSFVIDGVHAHDIATIFDSCGIAVRAGHHCAMPLMGFLGESAVTRISFSIYNSLDDINKLSVRLTKFKRYLILQC